MKKLLLTSIMLSAGVGALAQTITVGKDNRTVAVTVTDDAQVESDTAVVSVGFTSYGSDQQQTYADATRISNRVIDALHAAGVRADAIQSADQSLTEIDAEDKIHSAKGLRFRFAQSWNVTVDASSAADVLHTAISAGANNSGNIQWKLKNEDALEAAAEEKALAHAQKVAERYAAGLKCRLGSMIYASNQVPIRGLFGATLNTETASASSARVNLKPLAIAPEKITKTATVYAVFAIE
ncbi:SIMPL domain-containing protein [Edaphobacter albus]|uniref:SIMPL domain-containing protein n=1 Tax=Edaphobacter sp. 4G125 TaxID=2763071 RepID=UPI001647448F|nr:SIMPL domain-containing protein [Edaphobacter sp. 4G125]QNI36368.1 SIMPL domain-containing protein [Edaphobacter sp. 4G125]